MPCLRIIFLCVSLMCCCESSIAQSSSKAATSDSSQRLESHTVRKLRGTVATGVRVPHGECEFKWWLVVDKGHHKRENVGLIPEAAVDPGLQGKRVEVSGEESYCQGQNFKTRQINVQRIVPLSKRHETTR